MFTNRTFEGWLLHDHRYTLFSVMSHRLQAASKDFLISKKLVTRSFSAPFIFNSGDLDRAELRRLYKIILVNLRKRIPLLKSGSETYEFPFVQIRLRHSSLDIWVKPHANVIIRYFRRIGLYDYLSDNKIPIVVSVADDGGRSTIRILPSNDSDPQNPLSVYLLIYGMDNIIKIMSSLHRLSYFREEVLVNEPRPNVVNDDFTPF